MEAFDRLKEGGIEVVERSNLQLFYKWHSHTHILLKISELFGIFFKNTASIKRIHYANIQSKWGFLVSLFCFLMECMEFFALCLYFLAIKHFLANKTWSKNLIRSLCNISGNSIEVSEKYSKHFLRFNKVKLKTIGNQFHFH